MKPKTLALSAALAATAILPVTAQAADTRAAAPVSGESNAQENSTLFYVLGAAALIALVIVIASDDDDDVISA